MSGVPIERIIRAVSKERIRSQKSFTSVDIANAIKRFGIYVRNTIIAERLKDCVCRWADEENIKYKTEVINVDAGNKGVVKATLYLPDDGTAQSDYFDRDQKAISPIDFDEMHKTKVMPWNKR